MEQMERVTFLIEDTGQRLSCMLNPNQLIMRRVAGLQPRMSLGGVLSGQGLADRPFLYTGAGTTWLELSLLFDVSLAGSTIRSQNVCDLTGPLWALAENAHQAQSNADMPPLVRMLWGKHFDFPGLVTAVAERLEYFTSEGIPRRSWLRMRMHRFEPRSQHPADRGQSSPAPLSIPSGEAMQPIESPLAPDPGPESTSQWMDLLEEQIATVV
jgi:hypothetical protein